MNMDTDDDLEANARREHNRGRADYRRMLLMTLSGGRYEPADIEAIYDAQEGFCYFTGEYLSKQQKNFAVDHLKPVRSGGSSWPGNLALVTQQANQEKHGHTAQWYWRLLEQRRGRDWAEAQRRRARETDQRRRQIDRARKRAITAQMTLMTQQLNLALPGRDIEYTLSGDAPTLWVADACVEFPRGFIRERRRFASLEYLVSIAAAIGADPPSAAISP
jgi:hypothetical protein